MILLYHHIAPIHIVPNKPEPGSAWHLNVSPDGFERHLIELSRRQYKFISLGEMVKTIIKTGKEIKKTVAITFDDGWRDNYEYALPILKQFDVPACFFVTTTDLEHVASVNNRKKMSIIELRELLKQGMDIGSHTCSHPNLTMLNEKDAKAEVENSKIYLENILGRPVDLFAFPGGAFNSRIAMMVRDAGYIAACSVIGPAINDRSTLFWLYRSILTEGLNTLSDWYRLSPFLTKVLAFRVRLRLQQKLKKCGNMR